MKVILPLPLNFPSPSLPSKTMLLFLSRMILLVPSNLLRLMHTHKISALRWRKLWDDHFFSFPQSSGWPPFSPSKTTGRQVDLSDSHSHCWSVRLSLLVFTDCHPGLASEASEALASAWSVCVNCTAPSLWMRLLCCVTSALLCIQQIHRSCSFLSSLSQGASVLLSVSKDKSLSGWPKCLKQ